MTTEKAKVTTTTTYPMISRKIWWLLRERFKTTIPTSVSPIFISSVVHMEESSAKANVIAPLRVFGLIDGAGKPTPIAEQWRHDDNYETVCHAIRAKVYPHDIIEAFPKPNPGQKEAIKSWFMKRGQVGTAAALRYTDTFMLLSEAELPKAAEKVAMLSTSKARRPAKATPKVRTQPSAATAPVEQHLPPSANPVGHQRHLPAIHIDVQVHISPDTSPEQIDRIFESMAKHLGSFVK